MIFYLLRVSDPKISHVLPLAPAALLKISVPMQLSHLMPRDARLAMQPVDVLRNHEFKEPSLHEAYKPHMSLCWDRLRN